MPDTDQWLEGYGAKRTDIAQPVVYWIAVLLLVLGVVGLLWAAPVPEAFSRISSAINWGTCFLAAAIIYYFILSTSLAIGMLPFVLGIAAFQLRISDSPLSLTTVSSVLITISILGLYVGRRNGLRGLIDDIQMLMIAPAWLLSGIYKRLGIPY